MNGGRSRGARAFLAVPASPWIGSGAHQSLRVNTSEFELNANEASLEIVMRPFARRAHFQGGTSPDQTFSSGAGGASVHFTRTPRAGDIS